MKDKMFEDLAKLMFGGLGKEKENEPFKFQEQPTTTKGGSYITDEMYLAVVEITKNIEKLVDLHNKRTDELQISNPVPMTDLDYCKSYQFMTFSDILNSDVIPNIDLLLSIHTLDEEVLKRLAQKEEKPFSEFLKESVKNLQFKRFLQNL